MKNFNYNLKVRLLSLMLFTSTIAISQRTIIEGYYTPKLPNIDLNEAKSNLTQVLSKTLCNGEKGWRGWMYNSRYPSKVEVFDDKFELTVKKDIITFYFSTLIKYDVGVSVVQWPPDAHIRDDYAILFDNISFYSRESDVANIKELADYLYFYQNQQKKAELKEYEVQLPLFESVASKYRTLQVKPTISEEQRKLIVQANFYNENKDFKKAIELYLKVTELDPIAYPASYSNLALIFAFIKDYPKAILYMKKYLMLEPNATDSRASQDKIYEWETQLEE